MRTRYVVQRLAFNGTGRDAFNNKVESWGDPQDVRIFGLNVAVSDEPVRGQAAEHNRMDIDRTMLVPRTFECSFRDRFTGLPGDPSGRVYEVVGVPEFTDRNPFGWHPGGKVQLRYVS